MEAETPTMFQGVAKAGAAFRLMQQMGWEEGNGLGKNKQGMKQHLRVRNKQDTAGIGGDKSKAQANWTVNTMTYDNILKKLQVTAVQAAAKDDDDDEGNSEDEVGHEVAIIKQEVVPKTRKVTRPQGRYKRREQGKMVGAYSETDLAGILGAAEEKTGIQTTSKLLSLSISSTTVVQRVSTQVSKESSSISVEEKSTTVSEAASTPEVELKFEDLPADWWGNKYGFVRAGGLGATSGVQKTERTAFREKDQEDLYNLVTDKATKSKKGLGRGSSTSKNLGADWRGQKKALDVGSDVEEELDEGTGRDDDKDVTTNFENANVRKRGRNEHALDVESSGDGIEKMKSKKQRGDGGEKVVIAEKVDVFKGKSRSGVAEGNRKSSYWKKICQQLLAEAPLQTLSLKRLQKRVFAALLLAYGSEVQLDSRLANLKEKLQKSSRFVVEGKKVSLSA